MWRAFVIAIAVGSYLSSTGVILPVLTAHERAALAEVFYVVGGAMAGLWIVELTVTFVHRLVAGEINAVLAAHNRRSKTHRQA